MSKCLHLTSILILAFFSFSCNRQDDGMVHGYKSVNALLDNVERVMDENPSYADSLIKRINPHSIRNNEQRARYALLYTAAQYKDYQTFQSDSLIMEAVRYYSIDRNINYRFLSYYYLGCVYSELNRFIDASVALTQAEQYVDKIDNDTWKGLLYFRLGSVFFNSCFYQQAEDYYYKASNCYELAGNEYYKMYNYYSVGICEMNMQHYDKGDSILNIVQKWSELNNYEQFRKTVYARFNKSVISENFGRATDIYNEYSSIIDEECDKDPVSQALMAVYYNQMGEYSKTEQYLKGRKEHLVLVGDSIYWNYYNSMIAERYGDFKQAFYYLKKAEGLDNTATRSIFLKSVLSAQKDYYQKLSELEFVKARNRLIVIMFFLLIMAITFALSLKNIIDADLQKKELISTINDLTTQISVNQDKISSLNDKVREMLRQQFNPSDFLYTRYYEQIDDSKKAERLYRVVKTQLNDFVSHKNIEHIDKLLDESFDGIMTKIMSSGMEIKEKDLLILRFVLAGFSSKSIAAILDERHLNINQRKKRLLDKIQIKAPMLMNELSKALNINQIDIGVDN